MGDIHPRHPASIPSLDGIRAVSVLLVVLSHSGFTFVPGGLGVTIFFFLSGYLITSLMLGEIDRTGSVSVANFYVRRILRLMPPLLVTLAIAYSLTLSGLLSGGITASGVASQLLYFANYYAIFFDTGDVIPAGTGILWSLAVEEHFYIFYPLIMAWLCANRVRMHAIGALLGIMCVIILIWRLYLVSSPNFLPIRTYYASDTRIDSIIYGCILAITRNPLRDGEQPGALRMKHWLLLALATATLLASLLYRNDAFREGVRYSLQGIALMPLFYMSIRFHKAPPFSILNYPTLRMLGVYSYVIYLSHGVIIELIGALAPAHVLRPFIIFVLAIAGSVLFSAAIDRFVEPYFRQLRKSFGSRTQ